MPFRNWVIVRGWLIVELKLTWKDFLSFFHHFFVIFLHSGLSESIEYFPVLEKSSFIFPILKEVEDIHYEAFKRHMKAQGMYFTVLLADISSASGQCECTGCLACKKETPHFGRVKSKVQVPDDAI